MNLGKVKLFIEELTKKELKKLKEEKYEKPTKEVDESMSGGVVGFTGPDSLSVSESNQEENSGQKKLYMRFGEIPKSGRSGISRSAQVQAAIWGGETKIEESGVSVYPFKEVVKDGKVKYRPIVDEIVTFHALWSEACMGERKIYIVRGIEHPEEVGTDGEPLLIGEIEIVKEISVHDIWHPELDPYFLQDCVVTEVNAIGFGNVTGTGGSLLGYDMEKQHELLWSNEGLEGSSFRVPRLALPQLIQWAKNNLQPIGLGCGDYRCVFDIGNGKVLKIAQSESGVQDNKEEIEDFECLGPDFAVRTFDYDRSEFKWLITQKLTNFNDPEEFFLLLQKIYGLEIPEDLYSFSELEDEFTEFLTMAVKKNDFDTTIFKIPESWATNDWLLSLVVKLRNCNLNPTDLASFNWGIDPSDGKPKILDIGGWRLSESLVLRESGIQIPSELRTHDEFLGWAYENLELLACGNERCGFDLKNNTVLKIANTGSGIRSNKDEVNALKCMGPEFAVEVLDHAPNYHWIITNKVETFKICDSFIRALAKYGNLEIPSNEKCPRVVERFLEFLESKIQGEDMNPLKSVYPESWFKNSWIERLTEKLKSCNKSAVDLVPSNWGVDLKTDSLKIIDLGGWNLSENNVLDRQGHKHIGSAERKKPYGDTYVDKSDNGRQANIVKKVNKNLDKRPYSLHDPPSMGISMKK